MEYVNERNIRGILELGYELSEYAKSKIAEEGSFTVKLAGNEITYTNPKRVPRILLKDSRKVAIRNTIRDAKHDGGYSDTWHADGKELAVRWVYVPNPDRESWDSAIYKTFLPDVHLSGDDKNELIEDMWEHWYNPYEDGRDCTGVWFTSGISVFDVPKGTWIYHFKSCDV